MNLIGVVVSMYVLRPVAKYDELHRVFTVGVFTVTVGVFDVLFENVGADAPQ